MSDKQSLREQVWDDLADSNAARFPFPPHGRIPNYAGADEAARRLTETDAWAAAETVKANPDAPQLPVRRAALRAGKPLYVAVPRLAAERPFVRLAPEAIEDVDAATTVSGIEECGEPVGPEAMKPIDLVVSGSVAVDESGGRVGKGEGYSDLEYALLAECGLVGAATVATTVHERQVRESVPVDAHDVPIDIVVTPERTVHTGTDRGAPTGVDWAAIDGERLAEIPVLERRRPE